VVVFILQSIAVRKELETVISLLLKPLLSRKVAIIPAVETLHVNSKSEIDKKVFCVFSNCGSYFKMSLKV